MKSSQKYAIPRSHEERSSLREQINQFVSGRSLVPPLSMEQLDDLAGLFIANHALDPETKGWLMVEINNCVWRETVTSIPYEKRILLLPKCLSNSANCKAEIDELGLLCHQCGHCTIPGLQDMADRLGMMSIVAEGFTQVVGLIENRVVDTVIGVSCLDSLEKAFPLLIDNAVPGMAIPLNGNGCKDTTVDEEYVTQMISMLSGKEFRLLNYERLKTGIREWFSKEQLARVLSPATEQTSSAALEWMGGEGKRWRPYLLAATYMALTGTENFPEEVQLAAIAVECFHKASLVHDDIQDHDAIRYGKPTVNALYGSSVAINVGDILLGEGYRLLSCCGNPGMISMAADAHIALCKGQGMELEWSNAPRPLTMDFVLDIFCNKTVPAFDVALMLGMICAGGDRQLHDTLHRYSRALGIAYQLLDDIEDYETDAPVVLRPSAVLAALCEQHPGEGFIGALFRSSKPKEVLSLPENQTFLRDAFGSVKQMAEQYRQAALDALQHITNVELKRLLFRVTKRILK